MSSEGRLLSTEFRSISLFKDRLTSDEYRSESKAWPVQHSDKTSCESRDNRAADYPPFGRWVAVLSGMLLFPCGYFGGKLIDSGNGIGIALVVFGYILFACALAEDLLSGWDLSWGWRLLPRQEHHENQGVHCRENYPAAAKGSRMWWPGTESNRRRRPFQGRALPAELPGHNSFILADAQASRRAARDSAVVFSISAWRLWPCASMVTMARKLRTRRCHIASGMPRSRR